MTTTAPTFRSDSSGHWYSRDAQLVEQVPAKTQRKGEPTKMVDVTLRQARELQLAPGQSTIRQVRARRQLQDWQEKQVLMAALTLPRNAGETDEQFVERVMHDSREHARTTAAAGTAIHQRIDAFLGTSDWSDPYVAAVGALLVQHAPRESWRTEQTTVSPLGYGTTADAYAPGFVLDIKTKEPKAGKTIADEVLYDDHYMQLAATRHALGMPSARCGIVFVDRTKPEAAIVWADEDKLQRGWKVFLGCLYIWQTDNNYSPDWAVAPTLNSL
jgi:hypothetical protein